MVKARYSTQLGGGNALISYQIIAGTAAADLTNTSSGTAQTIALDTYPQGSVIVYIRVKHSVAFAGGSLTAMKVRVGKSTGVATTDFFVADFDIFQAVADGTLKETWATSMGQLSACAVTATFTPTGDSVSAATAGQVAIDVIVFPVTTPTTAAGLYAPAQTVL